MNGNQTTETPGNQPLTFKYCVTISLIVVSPELRSVSGNLVLPLAILSYEKKTFKLGFTITSCLMLCYNQTVNRINDQ